MIKQRTDAPEVNTGSMADIAFLLLIFFLVTTTIARDKGLLLKLPPKQETDVVAEVHDRNVFKVMINADNKFLIEGETARDLTGLKLQVVEFVQNNGTLPHLSDSPQDAVISIKTSRGTDYGNFIHVLDEVKGAYYQMYGERIGLTAAAFRQLDLKEPKAHALNLKARAGMPMNISIAEPEKITR